MTRPLHFSVKLMISFCYSFLIEAAYKVWKGISSVSLFWRLVGCWFRVASADCVLVKAPSVEHFIFEFLNYYYYIYISLQSMLLSPSLTSLYPALHWFVNFLYHCHLCRSLRVAQKELWRIFEWSGALRRLYESRACHPTRVTKVVAMITPASRI